MSRPLSPPLSFLCFSPARRSYRHLKKKKTQMIQFSYSSSLALQPKTMSAKAISLSRHAGDFGYGVRSRDYDHRTPLHIPSLQGWIDVSGHVLIHGRIDMLLLPFMVIGFSSVSPIEDGSAKSQCDLWKKIEVCLCGDCLRECWGKSRTMHGKI